MSAAADAEDKTEKHAGDAGPASAGARALWRDAARARHGERGFGRLRGDARPRSQTASAAMPERRKPPRSSATAPRQKPTTRSSSGWSGSRNPTARRSRPLTNSSGKASGARPAGLPVTRCARPPSSSPSPPSPWAGLSAPTPCWPSGRWNDGAAAGAVIRPGRGAMAFPHGPVGQGQGVPCKASDCGTEVTVYVRAKIGFCNCTTGVSDDEELDRISDFDLFGNELSRSAPGRPIAVAWMKGRSRAFMIGGAATGRQVGAIGRVQRPLRCDRCDRGAGARTSRPRSSRRCSSSSTARPCCTGPK